MQQAGRKLIARWREAGEWWSGEPYREVRRTLDERGIRHEEERFFDAVGNLARSPETLDCEQELHNEEWSLKKQKRRDEKVRGAAGAFSAERSASRSRDPGGSRQEVREESGEGGEQESQSSHLSRIEITTSPTPNRALRASLSSPHRSTSPYVPLHVVSGYAFGRGTMLADEIPLLCAHAGIPAVAITDPFSLVGAVEMSGQARKCGVKPLIGASLEMEEGGELVLIAKTKLGYQNLSRLVTACHLEEPRLFPLCNWSRLQHFSEDLICLTGGDCGPLNPLLTRRDYKLAKAFLEKLVAIYGRENVCVEIERSFLPWEIPTNDLLLQLAERLSLTAVAGGIVTHARRDHFAVQDILVCAESLCLVDEIIGRKPQRHQNQSPIKERPKRSLNAERFLRTPQEMSLLFSNRFDLLANSIKIADSCDDDVLPGRTQLPKTYANENYVLREYTYAGALIRHKKLSAMLKKRIDFELERIARLNFSAHFLTIWDACRWAADQNIQFSGRGSVVDSAVAYCLGLSRIDAYTHNLHFDRFLPQDGSKRPDIDIDFESRRRDDVRNYLTRKYGQDRVATVAAVGAYCTRGIVREVGKALGLPNELIGYLAKRIHGGISPNHLEEALEKRPELRGSSVPRERFKWVFHLAERLMDIPRNMRAHSSGVVISSRPLSETVPVMWSASPGESEESDDRVGSGAGNDSNGDLTTRRETRNLRSDTSDGSLRIIQWDKRSAKHYFDKFDILCLRGQDVLSGTQERIRINNIDFSVEGLPMDDEHTYGAMRSGELIGIPQSASPAMRQAHIRLRTQNLHDASLVQAGIRPGVGGAVKLNELIARRRGTVSYGFSHPELERILGLTYGIIVFQEQVDQLLQAFCGFSSGEAEDMREAIHERRREDYGRMVKQQILDRILSQGHDTAIAEEVFQLVAGFKGYGFAQGHALAFAEVSIRSIYCQQNFPAEYFSALLSAQPAGYYGPCTLVNEARSRGVAILPPDANKSRLEFSVEDVKSVMAPYIVLPGGAIRVGINQIAGLSQETKQAIVDARGDSEESIVSSNEGYEMRRGTGPGLHGIASSHCVPRSFLSFFNFVSRVRPERDELEKIILSGVLDSVCPNRRAMLWSIPAAQKYAEACIPNGGLPLDVPEPEICHGIDDFSSEEKAIYERMFLDLDVKEHLMSFERERVKSRGGMTTSQARRLQNGRKAIVVGNPIRLRFPPTPSGKRVVFFDLEDETGLLNVTCFDAVYQRDGHAIVCSPYVTLIGEAQDRDGHIAFLAHRVFPYNPVILSQRKTEIKLPIATGDFLVG